jgi:DNA (cytosine-5)-methyltransferase 1
MQVRVVDFFAGCGGASLGFALAQSQSVTYRMMGGVERDRHAAATYRRALGVSLHVGDIQDLREPSKLQQVSAQWAGEGPLLLIGCAPCQGFSSHRKKDPREDARNGLLSTFADIAVRLQPELVVMENVPEMLSQKHWPHFEEWRTKLLENGYTVKVAIHNLAEFGVPQERFRALVVAAKWRYFAMPRGTLTPQEFRTVKQAIGHLPTLEAGGVDPDDPMHMTSKHRSSTVELIKHIPLNGGSRKALPPGIGPTC